MSNQNYLNDTSEQSRVDSSKLISIFLNYDYGIGYLSPLFVVRVSEFDIREYEITLRVNHRETSNYPSISLERKHDESLSFKVHSCKITKIVKGNDFLLLSQREQEKLLFNAGYSKVTIKNSIQITEKCKKQKEKRRTMWPRRNRVVHDAQSEVQQKKSNDEVRRPKRIILPWLKLIT